MGQSTVTLKVVANLDGFIARHDNDVSWLDLSPDAYARGATEDSAAEVVNAIGCYLLGSRTYEHALQLGWPYGETPGRRHEPASAVHAPERGDGLRLFGSRGAEGRWRLKDVVAYKTGIVELWDGRGAPAS